MKFATFPSKRRLVLFAPLLSGLLGLACRSETGRLFADAARAEEADDYEGAARRLREIVIGHPESPFAAKAKLQLAQIHLLRTRDIPAAHAVLVELIDDYPQSPVALPAHRLLARLYEREMRDLERAIPHYVAVLEGESDVDVQRETLASLGECHYGLGQLEEAATAYRKAAELPYDSSSDAAYLRVSTLSRLSGDHDAALRWLEELAKRTTDPTRRYTALLGQVETLITLERFDDARDRLDAAEHLAPDAPENDVLLARLDSAEAGPLAMDGRSENPESLEQRIHWGSGRAPRRER
jgi:tetratricopeptide (TPR) repeat protein